MLTHKLDLAPDVHDQDVMCIHTTLPAYLFVFRLNRLLGLSLSRSKEDLTLHSASYAFAVYEYESSVMQQSWRVVENRRTASHALDSGGLFAQLDQSAFLFPQLDRVDLLVCVTDLTTSIQKKIQQIAHVLSCYKLPKNQYKIKELLTF